MILISKDSEAYVALVKALASPVTYRVGLKEENAGKVSLKVNEGVWSLPLRTGVRL